MARRPEFRKPVLTAAELKRHEAIADGILAEILAKEKKQK
jgi:hypothetical protein